MHGTISVTADKRVRAYHLMIASTPLMQTSAAMKLIQHTHCCDSQPTNTSVISALRTYDVQ